MSKWRHYTVEHYLTGDYEEAVSFRRKRMRADQVNAVRYMLGHYTYDPHVPDLWDAQVQYLERLPKIRTPNLVLSVGSGRGELEAGLSKLGIPYQAIDPAPGAAAITPRTVKDWSGIPAVYFPSSLSDTVNNWRGRPDTLVFSESIEHITANEFNKAVRHYAPCLLIVTNRLDYHPIDEDGTGWNHIRRIDDKVYDQISKWGDVLYRNMSHLVVQL